MKLFDGFKDCLPEDGEYDMRQDTTGMPNALALRINNHICFKGGGGGGQTQTTTSGIDPEFKPYLERALSDVTNRYEADVQTGPDAIVARMTPEQTAALQAQKNVAYQKMSGTGSYDRGAAHMAELRNRLGNQRFDATGKGSNYGTLGSARQQASEDATILNKSLEMQKEKSAIMEEGVGDLGKAGTTLQQYQQERLDAPHTSAQRYFGYLSGAPQQSKTETTGGGGGK
jgi:hypothetical protein